MREGNLDGSWRGRAGGGTANTKESLHLLYTEKGVLHTWHRPSIRDKSCSFSDFCALCPFVDCDPWPSPRPLDRFSPPDAIHCAPDLWVPFLAIRPPLTAADTRGSTLYPTSSALTVGWVRGTTIGGQALGGGGFKVTCAKTVNVPVILNPPPARTSARHHLKNSDL